jgi:hypothetical protein
MVSLKESYDTVIKQLERGERREIEGFGSNPNDGKELKKEMKEENKNENERKSVDKNGTEIKNESEIELFTVTALTLLDANIQELSIKIEDLQRVYPFLIPIKPGQC